MGFLTAFSRVVLDMTVAVRMRIMTMMIITIIIVIIITIIVIITITIIIQVVTLVILTLPGFPPYTTFSPVKFPSPPPWTGDHNVQSYCKGQVIFNPLLRTVAS